MALTWHGVQVVKMTHHQRMRALDEIVSRLDAMRRQQRRNAAWHAEEMRLELMRDAIWCAASVEHYWRAYLGDPTRNDPEPAPPTRKARRTRC
jgi:hypothetical protein